MTVFLSGSTVFSAAGWTLLTPLNVSIIGASTSDTLTGSTTGDFIAGKADNDTLNGGAGLGDTADYSDKFMGSISVKLRGANEAQVLPDGTVEDLILNIENLIGGLGADILMGDAKKNELSGNAGNDTLEGKNGRDTLNGAAGEDVLQGGASRDTLTGGGDSDRFDFDTITDTGTTNSTRDVITDFVAGEDKIDLSGIDANSVGGGANDTFSFITSGSFTSPGQIMVVTSGATKAIVSINTDGDNDADATILLRNVDAEQISAGDFIL